MVLDDINFPSQGTADQTAKILDGTFIVQMPSKVSKTFQDFTDDVFMVCIVQQLNNVHRLDVVWGVYIAESLKTSTRQKRGHGQQRVSPSAPIPSDRKGFLRNDANKQDLFAFLAKEIEKFKVSGKQIVSTCHENVVCSSGDISLGNLAP